MASTVDVAAIAQDARWLPHRYDPQYDAVHFVRVDRDEHRRTTFLIDDELPQAKEPLVLTRAESVAAAASTARPLHFIFHSAYCCSTLLARAFDLPGVSMGLKEPSILNDMVGWRRRGGEARQVSTVLDGVLTLLAQPFSPGESIVAKPSNIVDGFAAAILNMRQTSNALLLHAPLRTYLTSVAKKGMWGRIWVRQFFTALLKDGVVDLGFDQEAFFGQTDLQIAAAGWLVQHGIFHALAGRFGPTRVRTLDSETLVARPREVIAALSDLFRLQLTTEQVATIVQGPAFSKHSKDGNTFSSADRLQEHATAASLHSDEIEKVAQWAEAVASSAGIPLHLTAPLLT